MLSFSSLIHAAVNVAPMPCCSGCAAADSKIFLLARCAALNRRLVLSLHPGCTSQKQPQCRLPRPCRLLRPFPPPWHWQFRRGLLRPCHPKPQTGPALARFENNLRCFRAVVRRRSSRHFQFAQIPLCRAVRFHTSGRGDTRSVPGADNPCSHANRHLGLRKALNPIN